MEPARLYGIHGKAVFLQRLEMVAPGDVTHRQTRPRQQPPEVTPDPACPHDTEPHDLLCLTT